MERSRIVTVALIALTSISVVNARHIIELSFANIVLLLVVGIGVHVIASVCSKYRKLQPISPIISFLFLIFVLLIANSDGNLSHILPSVDSLVGIFHDTRNGVIAMRSDSPPFTYSREIFLVAIVMTWAMAEIGETLAQRLHSSAPTLLWYLLINAGIVAQEGSTGIIIPVIAICAASWFYLYAFERGHEASKSHVIKIPQSSQLTNLFQYITSFVALLIISIFLAMPVTNLPSLAPNEVFNFLDSSKDQTELSPLVSMTQQLKDQNTVTLFTASANEAQYWRVAVLDDFDGEQWSANSNTKQKPETIPSSVVQRQLTGTVELKGLAPKFLPTFYSTQSVSSKEIDFLQHGVLYAKNDSVKKYSFSATAPPKDLSPEQIAVSSEDPPASVESSTLLPTTFDKEIILKARSIARGKGSLYEQVIALRDFFLDGSFVYDLNVDYSSSTNAMQDFLENRRGFCEQFATTYAAMSRSIGIPARVVVGFTPGDPDINGQFTITSKQAHSWVEVYISNFGWLTIDPTPPGPLPGQAPSNIGVVVTTTTTTTLPSSTSLTTPTSQSTDTTQPAKQESNGQNKSNSFVLTTIMLLLIGGSIAIYVIYRRKKLGSKNDTAYIVATFKEIGEKVLEVPPSPDLTISELVRRVPENNERVLEFLALLTLASYAPGGDNLWKELRHAASRARTEKIDIRK